MNRRRKTSTIVLGVQWLVGLGVLYALVWAAQNFR